MAQVIRNLVSNALKFTPRRGKVTVTASHIYDSITYKDGSTSGIQKLLRIEVKDSGAGISQVILIIKILYVFILQIYILNRKILRNYF